MIAPGYGMAVAQAQHAVRELERALEAKGVEVKYAIHPVAGRMPGHMNVLLAEADVPYDLLKEMDEINPEFSRTDVTLVIGANDVTNPAANERSQIADLRDADPRGRPRSGSVIVLKRSMASGFAGIDNPLFYDPKTAMLFGDAKASVSDITLGGPGCCSRIAAPARSMDPNRLKAIPLFSHLSEDEARRLAALRDRDEHRRWADPDEARRLLDRADRDRGGHRRRAARRPADRLAEGGRPDRRDGPALPRAAQCGRDRHLADARDQADALGDPADVRRTRSTGSSRSSASAGARPASPTQRTDPAGSLGRMGLGRSGGWAVGGLGCRSGLLRFGLLKNGASKGGRPWAEVAPDFGRRTVTHLTVRGGSVWG